MGYREDYFKAHEGMKLLGKRGTYYRCCRCGDWFMKSQIQVDHIIPKRKGGTDDLWNLQALCIHCNTSKGYNQSTKDTVKGIAGAAMNSGLDDLAVSVAKRKAMDLLGMGYKR